MYNDPQGYYARLEVDRDAAPEAIHMAFRRKARVLHPDIPGTGNAAAFLAVKEAYDVLNNPLSRAAYDRSAHAVMRSPPPPPHYEPGEISPEPPQYPPMAKARGPRWSDLPTFVWAGIGVMVLVAGLEAGLNLSDAPSVSRPTAEMRPLAPRVASQPAVRPQAPIWLTAAANAYVLPAGGPAVVLRRDDNRNAYVPVAELPAFSAVQALHLVQQHGLMEIRLSETTTGFIDATRLTPGNMLAARRAYCAYNAGPPPANAEVLGRNGNGAARVEIKNRTGLPLVVKLRDTRGAAAATVYVAPDGDAQVGNLPEGKYQPEYAVGELWSRTCESFAGGMRAQRFSVPVALSAASVLVIPPDLISQDTPADISDQAFERE